MLAHALSSRSWSGATWPFSCHPGARRSCLSSSGRAMNRCPSSAGRGQSASLAFGASSEVPLRRGETLQL
eukprot:scaffold59827_cov38-Phaeocystis_antarctica.AAC.2